VWRQSAAENRAQQHGVLTGNATNRRLKFEIKEYGLGPDWAKTLPLEDFTSSFKKKP